MVANSEWALEEVRKNPRKITSGGGVCVWPGFVAWRVCIFVEGKAKAIDWEWQWQWQHIIDIINTEEKQVVGWVVLWHFHHLSLSLSFYLTLVRYNNQDMYMCHTYLVRKD